MGKLKAALFDLDGVVFDTETQYTVFWGRQFQEFYPGSKGLEHEIKGQTLVQIFDGYFRDELEEKRGLISRRLKEYEKGMHFDYIDGFEQFMTSLRLNGIKTALVTSSDKGKMEIAYRQRPELKEFFDAILTSEDFDRSKPDPDCYEKGAARLGATKEGCIVLEDSFNGLKAGRAAGMKVVGFATTNPRESIETLADIVVDDYKGLTIEICERLLGVGRNN